MAMFYPVNLFITVCIPAVSSVSVQVNGVIDLGPNWNYEYKLEPSNVTTAFKHKVAPLRLVLNERTHNKTKAKPDLRTPTESAHNEVPELRVTQVSDFYKQQNKRHPKNLYDTLRTVKNDTAINDFTFHVYKQSLKVFDEIKTKLDPSVAHKVDALSRTYDQKFKEFLNETLDQKIKTRLGSQRVILNTMDTSNRLLKRLVSYFIGDMKKQNVLRNKDVAVNVFQKEVDRECNLEMIHICSKFKICRTSEGFGEFLISFLHIIIKNDKGIKTASDALTEVLKNTDFKKIMDSKTRRKFSQKIEEIEKYDKDQLRAMFMIGRNVIALQNQPLKVMQMAPGSDYVNKTVAFFEVMDTLITRLPANDDNILEWADIKNSLTDWSEGKRSDILEVMQGFIGHIKKKAIDTLNHTDTQNLRDKLAVIFA